jgi:hypothetical protein
VTISHGQDQRRVWIGRFFCLRPFAS